ncbi:MAG: hypothetical protein PHX09_02995 [Clostridia bacterium]|nr:hypothetical protein [Clostridia bacterium]MDD4685759.1 hypothetical protein [Clostridia bacterium]
MQDMNYREQPEESQMLIADANEKLNENIFEQSVGSLGKFKNTQSLLTAYNNLQAEFTRKCQRLKELERNEMQNERLTEKLKLKDDKMNNASTENEFSNENEIDKLNDLNVNQSVNQTLNEQEEEQIDETRTEKQEKEEIKSQNISELSLEDTTHNLTSTQNSQSNIQSDEELIKNDEFIKNFINTHDDIKQGILKSYLEELQKNKSPKIILSSVGSGIALRTPPKPTNLEEAKEIVEKMFT